MGHVLEDILEEEVNHPEDELLLHQKEQSLPE